MKSKFTLFLLSVSLFISWTFGNNDPCVGYKEITNDKRSALYSSSKTEANICDLDIDESVWYRFNVLPPKRLHDKCVPELKCGTEQPIWLNGEHPTIVDPGPKDVKVCSPRDDNCCGGWSSMIKVKYCRTAVAGDDDFYVYLLKKPPRCVMAYCAGNTAVCPEGQTWNEFIELCTEIHPVITNPEFTGPHRIQKTIMIGLKTELYDDFYFNCIVKWVNPRPDKRNQGEQFKVVFTFDGMEEPSVPAKITDGSQLSIRLSSNELVGHAGKTVSCKVRSYWRKLEKSSSPYHVSATNHFVGIRYSKESKDGPFTSPRIEIDENSDGLTLHFQPTVPVSCPVTDHQTTCKFSVVIEDMSQKGVGVSDCSIVFSALDPTMKDWTLKIKPRPTPGTNSRTSVIRFRPILTNPEFFWHNYKLPDITILIRDTSVTGVCSSCGDPHITTFDGRLYHAYMEGDYLLAKSTSPRHFEVHVRHHKCGGVSCNCAVAVREGNNVLGVYACNAPNYTPTPMRYLSDPDAPGATITNHGNVFIIMMPSGAYVRMEWYAWHSSIYLYLNSEDYSKTSGLCGTFNRNKDDDTMAKGTEHRDNRDVPVTFSESYRLTKEESFFNGNIFRIKCEDFKAVVPSICSCENNRVVGCSAPENAAKAFGTKFTNHCEEEKKKNPAVNLNRIRRALDLNETETYDKDEFQKDDITKDEDVLTDEDMPLVTFDENYGRNVTFTWPTKSGLSESEARRQCQFKMESSPVFNMCKDQISDRLDGIVMSCVTDIQISDNVTTSVSYIINNLQTNCVQKMESSIVRNENDTSPPSTSENLLQEMMSKMCPEQCNNNGDCRNGTCSCNVGFGGEDCSVNIREPPRISEFRKGDKCDRQKFPCSQTSIFATNFYRSDKLVCKVKTLGLSNEFVFGASIVSSQEVSCKLPTIEHVSNKSAKHRRNLKTETISAAPFHHFEITVTNDGNLYSNSLRMTVYDSKCQECNSDGKCTRKPETCVIDGRCYLTNETSSSNNCLLCLPSISTDKWTTVKSEKCSSGCSLDVSTFLAIFALLVTLCLLK